MFLTYSILTTLAIPVVQGLEFSWPEKFARSDLFSPATASDQPIRIQRHHTITIIITIIRPRHS